MPTNPAIFTLMSANGSIFVNVQMGLRLTSETTGETIAEAYLLLSLTSAVASAPD